MPEYRHILDGVERADSMVVNPHKWLFTPFDLSAFYCRRMDLLRQAFSLTPEYLRTTEAGAVKNLMDTGVQLGRRFRALKLWMILRYFGAEGLRARLVEHMRLARLFAGWVDADPDFERLAPVPFSVVCFRARPRGPERGRGGARGASTSGLLDAMNATGEVFLSHTKLNGRFTLRLAVGNLRTEERHVARAWELAKELTEATRKTTAPRRADDSESRPHVYRAARRACASSSPGFSASPPRTTILIRLRSATFASGSPSTANRSALKRVLTSPRLAATPSISAQLTVAARIASAGARPAFTRSASSRCTPAPGTLKPVEPTSTPVTSRTPAIDSAFTTRARASAAVPRRRLAASLRHGRARAARHATSPGGTPPPGRPSVPRRRARR